ncbi:MAG TPA: hypothetical protein VEC92_00705 [Nitrososphaerales archaeon]|nr:hypothetical protein [Nitrososphaerales archaeon]
MRAPESNDKRVAKAIQASVFLSVILGVLFLVQAYGLVPSFVFEFVAIGWVLFVVDAALTFVSPKPAYTLALVLAILALASSLPQSSHWAFIANGDVLPAFTFLAGSAVQVALIVLVLYYFALRRRKA